LLYLHTYVSLTHSINTLTRVLLVDDESDVNATLREELEQNEVKVDSYESPLLALESFMPYFYELAILVITEILGK